jgi:hypothetical protein
MLESSQVPGLSLVEVIRKGLINLEAESIRQVKVYGRLFGEEIPDWSQEFELTIPTSSINSVVSSSPTSAKNKTSKVKSQQQKFSQSKVDKWKPPLFIVIITALMIIGISSSLPNFIIIHEIFKGRDLSDL